ncbi:MAG TPA: calcium-binding protein [Allosphingosinicella sp.]|jgi:Ca2+-binding RTX toxin-like protein|uniref:calcium-binding protein n=1 Tax=Allosphingosinicella sp. TaxID=2823234 RepID=UPI002F2ABA39
MSHSGTDFINGDAGSDTLVLDWRAATGGYFTFSRQTFTPNPNGGFDGRYENVNGYTVNFTSVEHFDITAHDNDIGDQLRTGSGNDRLFLLGGNDYVDVGSGLETADGGAGDDGISADLSATSTPITWNLQANSYAGPAGTSFTNFEYFGLFSTAASGALRTGSGDDTIVTSLNLHRDIMHLGGGNDTASVFRGSDTVHGDAGNDTLTIDWSSSSSGSAYFTLHSSGFSLLVNSAGGFDGFYDNINGSRVTFTSIDHFHITAHDNNIGDQLRTGSGNDRVFLLGGNDYVDVGSGLDTADGGAGIDGISVDLSTTSAPVIWDLQKNSYAGPAGTSFTNFEYFGLFSTAASGALRTGSGDDTIVTSLESQRDIMHLGGGNDTASVFRGSDTVHGDAGDDTLIIDWSSSSSGSAYFTTSRHSLSVSSNGGFDGFYDNVNGSTVTFTSIEHFHITAHDNNLGDDIRTAGGNDRVTALGGNDRVNVGAGDDVVTGGAGNDTLIGEAGSDTAVFSGKRSDYRITYNDTSKTYFVSDQRAGAPDGTDSLFEFEFVQFSDGIRGLGQGASAGMLSDVIIRPEHDGSRATLVESVNAFHLDVAALEGGGFAMLSSDFINEDGESVYRIRLFNDERQQVGEPIQLSTTQHSPQPHITALSNGRFAVTYTIDHPVDRADVIIITRIFEADGAEVGEPKTVDNSQAEDRTLIDVEGLSDGSYVVVWSEGIIEQQTTYGQRYAPTGETIGQSFTLAGAKESVGDIEALPDGKFVISYTTQFVDRDALKIYPLQGFVRLFSNDGTPATQSIAVTEPTASPFAAEIAALDNGGFAIAYRQDQGAIHVQVFDAAGQRVANDAVVTTLSQIDLDGIRAVQGGFLVYGFSPHHNFIGQQFTAEGELVGAGFDITPRDDRERQSEAIGKAGFVELADGRLLVVYPDYPRVSQVDDAGEIVFDFDSTSLINSTVLTAQLAIPGTQNNNILTGSIGDDRLTGLDGNDDLFGKGGDDVLIGGPGADKLDGGAGTDTASYLGSSGINLSLSNPAANSGDAAGDTFNGIERFVGSEFQDIMAGDDTANHFDGAAGDDFLFGLSGNDTLIGALGDDVLEGGRRSRPSGWRHRDRLGKLCGSGKRGHGRPRQPGPQYRRCRRGHVSFHRRRARHCLWRSHQWR